METKTMAGLLFPENNYIYWRRRLQIVVKHEKLIPSTLRSTFEVVARFFVAYFANADQYDRSFFLSTKVLNSSAIYLD